jgi:hypothetical protein
MKPKRGKRLSIATDSRTSVSTIFELQEGMKMDHKISLDALGKLALTADQEPTLLQLAGFNEEMASSLLRFFLSPRREHGWKSLLLDALLSCCQESGARPDPDSIAVHREEETENGNKLDVIIESDTLVIGIENKVTGRPAQNPFPDYWAHLKSCCETTGREPRLILLTPRPVNRLTVPVPVAYVTYGQLFAAVKKLVSERHLDQGARYASLWADFERSIRHLSGETEWDNAIDRCVTKHSGDIWQLEAAMRGMVDAVQREAEMLLRGDNIEVKSSGKWSWQDERKVKITPAQFHRRWQNLLFDSYFVEVRIWPKSRTFLQAALHFGKGWEIQLFEDRPHREGEPPVRLQTWLRRNGIETRHSSLMRNLLAYGDELDSSAQPRNVANVLCELVRKVNEALRAATPALAPQPEPAKLPESWASTSGSAL